MIYIDNQGVTDPHLNLAIEEYVLRFLDTDEDCLLLYINEPSIIIGRNQNVHEEINHEFVEQHEIPVIRRISGGGAVYHDPGNLNFSFITDYEMTKLNNYKIFNGPVIQVLKKLDINAYLDERNAMMVGKYKISGNAQFSSSGRMVSHGTLLFDSNLNYVEHALKPGIRNISSRAHKSVRSTVKNISEFLQKPMTILEFKNFLLKGLQQVMEPIEHYKLTENDWGKIRELKTKYTQWDWNYGRSPKFTLNRKKEFDFGSLEIDLEVHKGRITDAKLLSNSVNGPLLYQIEQQLIGTKYDPESLANTLKKLPIHDNGMDLELNILLKLLYGPDH